MHEETKYQSSPYLDEVDALKRSLRSSIKTDLDEFHPLTINAVNPSLLRQKDKDWLKKHRGFKFEDEPKAKAPAKKAAAKKTTKKVAKKK